MEDQAELERRLREWLQPPAEVIDRVRETATNARRRRRPTRRLAGTLAVGLAVVLALLVLPLRRSPAGRGTAFTLETMGDLVIVRANGNVWVRPLAAQERRDTTSYLIVERKRP